jgi:hypothetical protein
LVGGSTGTVIAKRIEAGREAMIAGLCESPLTFQAIIIWRDEFNDGKVHLGDIIDLEATYAGPDAKNNTAMASGVGVAGEAPPAATPYKAPTGRPDVETADGERKLAELQVLIGKREPCLRCQDTRWVCESHSRQALGCDAQQRLRVRRRHAVPGL